MIRTPREVDVIAAELRSESARDRGAAAIELGLTASRRAVGPLLDALANDEDGVVRLCAVGSLRKLGFAEAADDLLRSARQDPSVSVRRSGLQAAAEFGHAEVASVALERLSSDDVWDRVNAVEALKVVGGAAAGAALRTALSDESRMVAYDAARSLVKIDEPDAEQSIREAAAISSGFRRRRLLKIASTGR